eukprot:TRINITY_DN2207_c0_g1_i2.p2 TRINITY_DN2207_c0_g1~~TRINITY_DN2207_c0_g1_i2.p2  ORF type:complete len:224 (-),score=57.53 TRINITY_DN2207_c0_g1_i2:2854-3525(-)
MDAWHQEIRRQMQTDETPAAWTNRTTRDVPIEWSEDAGAVDTWWDRVRRQREEFKRMEREARSDEDGYGSLSSFRRIWDMSENPLRGIFERDNDESAERRGKGMTILWRGSRRGEGEKERETEEGKGQRSGLEEVKGKVMGEVKEAFRVAEDAARAAERVAQDFFGGLLGRSQEGASSSRSGWEGNDRQGRRERRAEEGELERERKADRSGSEEDREEGKGRR